MEIKKDISEVILEGVRLSGICEDGYRELSHLSDKDKMVDYYIVHPEWGMARDFPDLQTLSDSFADYEEKGVYVNRVFKGEVFSRLQTYVFHNCKGVIRVAMDYENAVIPMLYFANGCDLTIRCDQENAPAIRVPIYETEASNNINCVESDSCEFIRHKIKIHRP